MLGEQETLRGRVKCCTLNTSFSLLSFFMQGWRGQGWMRVGKGRTDIKFDTPPNSTWEIFGFLDLESQVYGVIFCFSTHQPQSWGKEVHRSSSQVVHRYLNALHPLFLPFPAHEIALVDWENWFGLITGQCIIVPWLFFPPIICAF